MDWTMIAEAFSFVMQIAVYAFLIYGAALSIASVLPEKYFRSGKREAAPARPADNRTDTVPNF